MILSLLFGFPIAWVALYLFIIRPKLIVFRQTAGIYAKIDAVEADLWLRAQLWLRGLKVLIAGVATSFLPLAPLIYDKIGGIDWTVVLPSEKAKLVALIVTILGIVGPMLMVVLHNFGLADAAATEPTQTGKD